MSIAAVVTGGYGNGTFNGSIAEVVTAGYSISQVVDEAYKYPVALFDSNDDILDNPTLVAGDARISIDEAAYVNLTNLPDVSPANSGDVWIRLTAAEVASISESAMVDFQDQAGSEWKRTKVYITSDEINGDSSGSSVLELLEGDHVETSTKSIIYKKNTTDILLEKDISGSLLPDDVTITTKESS